MAENRIGIKMKKVMILGAGRGQIPLMELCHKYGANVIAVSPKGNYPGFSICDEAIYEDIKNKEAVLAKAQELSVDAIISDQLDQAVPTVAFVAEKMGLPGITYETALKFTNKYKMRQAAQKLGINVPESRVLTCFDDAVNFIQHNILTFPLIMKPVDGAASNGVFKVNSLDEIKEHFEYTQDFSKTRQVILEKFIYGKEYVVEAYTHNFIVTNLMVGHRDYFDIPGAFIPAATVFQDALHASSEIEKQLMAVNKKIVNGYGLRFGITHGEFLVEEKTGKIYLVEIAARGGGVSISSEIIPAATGVNANELLVKDALNIYEDEIEIRKGAAAYFCYLVPEGVVKQLNGIEDVLSIPGVKYACFDNIALGMKTGKVVDKYSRKGPIVVFGNEKNDCYDIIQCVKQKLDVKIESVDGIIKGTLWS